jgi:hypothetical protein
VGGYQRLEIVAEARQVYKGFYEGYTRTKRGEYVYNEGPILRWEDRVVVK